MKPSLNARSGISLRATDLHSRLLALIKRERGPQHWVISREREREREREGGMRARCIRDPGKFSWRRLNTTLTYRQRSLSGQAANDK